MKFTKVVNMGTWPQDLLLVNQSAQVFKLTREASTNSVTYIVFLGAKGYC